MMLRTVFMGSPAFAVPCLQVVSQRTHLLAVVCQPDKPAGRGLSMVEPATKKWALQHGIPVFQPVSIRPNRSNFIEELKPLAPDLIVVVAYGKILPPELLAMPVMGCWNVHASLLPKYRGAAPIQWALIQGETKTGVSLMQLDEGMDTGPVFFDRLFDIADHDTAATLQSKLAVLGAEMLQDALSRVGNATLPSPVSQISEHASLAPLLKKEHGLIDFSRRASQVSGQMRGVDPWPGAYTFLPSGEVLKLFSPVVVEGTGLPGTCLGVSKDGLVVACGEKAVCIKEVQMQNRNRMHAEAWSAGFRRIQGLVLGDGKQNALIAPTPSF